MVNQIAKLFQSEFELPENVSLDLAEKFLQKAPKELVDALMSKSDYQYKELSIEDISKVFDTKSFITAYINMAGCIDDDEIYKEVLKIKQLEHEVEKLYETE